MRLFEIRLLTDLKIRKPILILACLIEKASGNQESSFRRFDSSVVPFKANVYVGYCKITGIYPATNYL